MNESRRQILLDTPHTETATGAIATFETDMVGRAKEVKVEIEPVQEGTPWIADTTESVPYNFRAVKGTAPRIGNSIFESVVGGTVAWNQYLHKASDRSDTTQGGITYSRSNGVIHVSGARAVGSYYTELYAYVPALSVLSGHCYLILFKNTSSLPSEATVKIVQAGGNVPYAEDANYSQYKFTKATKDGNLNIYVRAVGVNEFETTIYPMQLFDLTAMFGSTIADYIYSLETATPGAGVAWFRKMFPEDYYEYNPGELKSVEGVSSHETVGFNQWDEEWRNGYYNGSGTFVAHATWGANVNPIKCFPGATYYYYMENTVNDPGYILFYDADGTYLSRVNAQTARNKTFITPENCYYINFYAAAITFATRICINLSDPTRNGSYEPYTKHSYPLDDSLTLRGIPKLDANNQLYYDGDTYESDGTVKRRYGVVDLGTLTWVSNGQDSVFANLPPKKVGSRNVICDKLTYSPAQSISSVPYNGFRTYDASNGIAVRVSGITPGNAKDNLSGMMLVYELATTTTETADPFQSPQVIDEYGTEEYVYSGTHDVAIPVGHVTRHADIYPISGWDGLTVEAIGKNLCEKPTGENVVYRNGGHLFTLAFSQSGEITWAINGNAATYFMLKGFEIEDAHVGKTVTMSFVSDVGLDSATGFGLYNPETAQRTFPSGNNRTLEITSDMVGLYLCARFYKANAAGQTIVISNIQIELGSTATSYEPYQGSTTPISWADEAGTVYGGTLEWEKDGTVKLTKTMASVDLGTLDWTNGSQMKMFFSTGIRELVSKPADDSIVANIISSAFTPISYNGLKISTVGRICISAMGSVGIVDGNKYASVIDVKTAVSGVQLVYELATPVTYTLTPQEALVFLRGTNNVWNDINDTSVTYWTHKTGDSV